jgi:hypothetical protein
MREVESGAPSARSTPPFGGKAGKSFSPNDELSFWPTPDRLDMTVNTKKEGLLRPTA